MTLAAAACARHPERPASGHCRRCGRGFCRECLTPHAGGLSCADCLRILAGAAGERARPSGRWPARLAALLGLLLLWLAYAMVGWGLARLPSDVHADIAPSGPGVRR